MAFLMTTSDFVTTAKGDAQAAKYTCSTAAVAGAFVGTTSALKRARLRMATPSCLTNTSVFMTQDSASVFNLYFVNVPTYRDVLTPGEVCSMELGYETFQALLSSGTTLFVQVHVTEWSRMTASPPRGALLSMQSVRRVELDGSDPEVSGGPQRIQNTPTPIIIAEVRCAGRADIVSVDEMSDDHSPGAWTIMKGVGRRVGDNPVSGIEDRIRIASLEWEAWQLCQEVSKMQRALKQEQGVGKNFVSMEQELLVWSPRDYDMAITEMEWSRTPVQVRKAWQARAEALSFAVLRRVGVSEEVMRHAMTLMSTEARLKIGIEELTLLKAMCAARLSVENAFGDCDST